MDLEIGGIGHIRPLHRHFFAFWLCAGTYKDSQQTKGYNDLFHLRLFFHLEVRV
jgi:hypothetical protein